MKFTINKEFLQTATSRLMGAISERSLSFIYLNAHSKLEVSASDMLFSVHSEFDVEITEPGSCFVPAKLFTDLVKELPLGDIKIDVKGPNLILVGGANNEFSMKIPLLDEVSKFEPPLFSGEEPISIPSSSLAYLIDQVQFSISQNSTRNFGAVGYFHSTKNDNFRLVGSDGFRLSYCEVTGMKPTKFMKNGICLSKRGLQELIRMSNEGFENIDMELSDDQTTMMARVENYRIYMRLSSVDYPNYQRVFPNIESEGVRFSRAHILSVIKRVLIASDKTFALNFDFSRGQLTVNSRNIGNYEGQEVIPAEDYTGENVSIAINGRFFIDVLSAMKSDQFKLYFKDADTPIVVKPESEPEHCDSLHVLVPIEDSAQG